MSGNLHIEVCETLGISRQELANRLDIAKSTIDAWTSNPERMSNIAKFAMELMLENHKLKDLLHKIAEGQKALIEYSKSDPYKEESVEDSHFLKELAERLKYVLNEFDLNFITGATRIGGGMTPERLDKILSCKIYPTEEFLDLFAQKFGVRQDWLFNNKGAPFDIQFIVANNINKLVEEISGREYIRTFIVHSENKKDDIKVIVKDKKEMFDIFNQSFNLSDTTTNNNDLLELSKFYYESGAVTPLCLKEKEFLELLSRKHYIGNILRRAKRSDWLNNLFSENLDKVRRMAKHGKI